MVTETAPVVKVSFHPNNKKWYFLKVDKIKIT